MAKQIESVKLSTEVVNKVRKNKERTGTPLSLFFELGAESKLLRENKQYQKKLRDFLKRKIKSNKNVDSIADEIIDYLNEAE